MKHAKKVARLSFLRSPYVIATLVVLCLYVATLLFPAAWGVWTMFKSNLEYLGNPIGLPETWHFENLLTALEYYMVPVMKGGDTQNVYIETMLLYSVLYAGGSALASALTCCLVAYVTAKFNFAFSKVIYGVVIVTMTLPIVGSLPSEIQMVRNLHLYDHIYGMWVLKANFLGLYYLVFYATFKSVPKDYAEAAYIDGGSNWTVMTRIELPLVRNIFFTVLLIKFIEFWNDYTINVTYLPSFPTLAYGLYEYSFSAKPKINNTPMRLAGCYILILPILIVFLFAHNRMMSNLAIGGVKE